MVHTSDFRRRRAVSPQPPPHGYSPPIIRPYHHRMYQRPKDGTHEAPSSLSFDHRRRRWLFVHQISLTVATNDATMVGILLPLIGTYHRNHRPNKVYLWSFVRYLPSSFPLFDRRRTMIIVWHLHRRSPPTADRRLRWVYNRKDAGMLIVRLHLTLTPTSLNLYTARQGYNHRRSISR